MLMREFLSFFCVLSSLCVREKTRARLVSSDCGVSSFLTGSTDMVSSRYFTLLARSIYACCFTRQVTGAVNIGDLKS